MYRAMALYFLRQGTDPKDEAAITAGCREVAVTLGYEGGRSAGVLNGENVTGQIRTEEVGMMASQTSAYGPVREKLTQLQKELARTSDVIMDGRDIGTCVLPQADVEGVPDGQRFRTGQKTVTGAFGKGSGLQPGGDRKGDRGAGLPDMHREHSPLKQAEDAYYLDSSDMTLEQVVNAIIELIDGKRGAVK